jgi:cytochrome c biogenesis protein
MKKYKLFKLLNTFSSVKLGITLLITLAITTLIGTIIPQEPMAGKLVLVNQFGQNYYKILQLFSLNDVFHSWWYLVILFFLAINLFIVSFKRVFPGSRKAILWPKFLKEENLKEFNSASIKATLDLNKWQALVLRLQKTGWQVRFNDSNDSLLARKGAFHRLGPSVTHVGILTTLLGAFISLLFGFNGNIVGIPGDRFVVSSVEDSQRSYILVQTSKIFHSPIWLGKSPEFEVEIGETSREDYANGSPKQWRTLLSFDSVHNHSSLKETVFVNHPVSFKGVDFYQADWKRVLKMQFNAQNFEVKLDKIKTAEVAFTSVSPELGLLFLLPFNSSKLNLISVVGKPDSELLLKNPNELIKQGSLKLLASLSPNQSTQIGPMNFKFVGAFSQTGIQYKHSPGDWLMIIGMVILVFGVLISFGSKRTIWAMKLNNNQQVMVIANADRAKEMFVAEFQDIVNKLV